MSAVMEMFNYATDVWAARQRAPGDDLATVIAQSTVDGDAPGNVPGQEGAPCPS